MSEVETVADAPEADDIAETEVQETENVETESEDNSEPSEDVDKELKTVRKALDKRNRYINNQRQRIRDLEAQIEKLNTPKESPKPPEMDGYENVLDYLNANQNYTLEQKMAEVQQKQQLEALQQQKQAALAEQTKVFEQQAVELANEHADFKNVIASNISVIEAMPDHINEMLIELDNGLMAAYALAKEGRLASLYTMPPQIAAAHLVQAEIRGQQYLQQSTQQKPPPKPIGSLKGGKSSTQSVPNLKGEKLLKWLDS